MPWKQGDLKLLNRGMVESRTLSTRKRRKELNGSETEHKREKILVGRDGVGVT